MPDFLLEIGMEEIPARMIQDAWRELAKRVIALVARESLLKLSDPKNTEFPELVFYPLATPRRLVIIVPEVAAQQPDVTEQITGPSIKVAYKDGKPTPAAEAFAKKAGLDVSKLETITNPKGEYLAATVTRKGRSAAEILAETVPKEIAGIYWAKNMYWRAGKPERFVRPVRWIVAMLDGEVVPLEFAGIKAARQSRGHRILGPEQVVIPSPAKYVETMQSAHVTASSKDREQKIRKALDAATRTIDGARWREDAALLETVVNLTEWPSAILGSFDQQFLALPEEVLVTVMRDHQKYFAVEDADGKLAPHFLAVLNTDGDPDGLIRHGNERVLRARFNDAQFFWGVDQKIPLIDRVEMLKAVTFQKDLGSYYDKAQRMDRLGDLLCRIIDKTGVRIDPSAIHQAAQLSKTDLTAELVKEFTELQGVVGGLYAKAQGLPQGVADAIYDQYKPGSTEDSAPRTLEGAVLSIADKADSIAGMFALGLIPSGSKDPFALRRQANGIVKTIVEHKLSIDIFWLLGEAFNSYDFANLDVKSVDVGKFALDVRRFFLERLDFYLREVQKFSYDTATAVLNAEKESGINISNILDVFSRASAVNALRNSADFGAISIAFKRMKNILRQAAEKKTKVAEPFDPAAFKDQEEKTLALAVPQVAKKVQELSASRQYEPALLEISRLRPAVDAFFDKVMVMVEDENLRANRLGLLQTLVREFSSIADFSEIVTAG